MLKICDDDHIIIPKPETLVDYMRVLEAMGYVVLKPGELRIVQHSTVLAIADTAVEDAVSAIRQHAGYATAGKLGQALLDRGLFVLSEKRIDGLRTQLSVSGAVRIPPKQEGTVEQA